MKKFFIFSLAVAVVIISLAVGFSNAEAADKVYVQVGYDLSPLQGNLGLGGP
jgi:hypothetical protein